MSQEPWRKNKYVLFTINHNITDILSQTPQAVKRHRTDVDQGGGADFPEATHWKANRTGQQ